MEKRESESALHLASSQPSTQPPVSPPPGLQSALHLSLQSALHPASSQPSTWPPVSPPPSLQSALHLASSQPSTSAPGLQSALHLASSQPSTQPPVSPPPGLQSALHPASSQPSTRPPVSPPPGLQSALHLASSQPSTQPPVSPPPGLQSALHLASSQPSTWPPVSPPPSLQSALHLASSQPSTMPPVSLASSQPSTQPPLHLRLTSELVEVPGDGVDGEHVGGVLAGDHRGPQERQGSPGRSHPAAGLIQEVEQVAPLLVQREIPAGEVRKRGEDIRTQGGEGTKIRSSTSSNSRVEREQQQQQEEQEQEEQEEQEEEVEEVQEEVQEVQEEEEVQVERLSVLRRQEEKGIFRARPLRGSSGATWRSLQRFATTVTMWVLEETVDGRRLSDIINTEHENVKYLPGYKLPHNVVAVPTLCDAVKGADLLVFVVPHQFVRRLCDQMVGCVAAGARGISLIKGIEAGPQGLTLISDIIGEKMGIDVSVLMGANIANEVAAEKFCETTIGSKVLENGLLFKELLQTPNFRVTVVEDSDTVELCGALKLVPLVTILVLF
ncbi:hypothetical protein CRUP_007775 [Coryphaenoides rupestris]|nr:hypothetical protein CRUP_007775 [Coryphaenoides rupestris]